MGMASITSFPALSAVTLATKHLAVSSHRAAAIAPRRDVVGLHLLDFEMFATDLANALLPFVHLAFRVVVEDADA